MNKLPMTALAAAIVFTFSAGASAALSKDEVKAGKDSIKANYKTAKAGCDAFAANARDICVAEAKGKEAIARAELEEGYKPAARKTATTSALPRPTPPTRWPARNATTRPATTRMSA